MALRISDLTNTNTFVGTDVFELSLAGAAGSRKVTGGNLRTQLFAGGTGFTATDPLLVGNITMASASVVTFGARGTISVPADGNILLRDNAGTGFNALLLGGSTSSFPRIQRSSTSILFQLADGSAGAPVTAASIALGTSPAQSGVVRIPSGQGIYSRNAGNSADIQLISLVTDEVVLAIDGGDIRWGRANVALGGGAAPTLGTIGGSGPAAAGQRNWLRFIESDGTASFIPVWR